MTAALSASAEGNWQGLEVRVRDGGDGVLEITAVPVRDAPGLRSAAPELVRAALREERFQHWLITLEAPLTELEMDLLVSLFPRRLALGRVAILCPRESTMQGVVLAAGITLPLVPRPVRVFPDHQSTDARCWIRRAEPSDASSIAELIMVGSTLSPKLPN